MKIFNPTNRIESISAFFALMPALDKQYTEVRLLNTGKGIVSGIFETTETGAAALDAELNRLHLNHRSVYATINQLDNEYVTAYKVKNKPNVLNVYAKEVTKDADIGRLTLIMLDFDPKRDTGISSTNEEKAAAKAKLCQMLDDFSAAGLPKPLYTTDSGNGYNCYLRIDFPNDAEHNKLVADFIAVCHVRYSDAAVDLDRSTKNPARIAKIPGSWSCKGESTEERPHRPCKLLTTNPDTTAVTADQLRAFIARHSTQSTNSSLKPDAQSTVKSTLADILRKNHSPDTNRKVSKITDVADWLDSYGLAYRRKEGTGNDGTSFTLYILEDCPFQAHDNHDCSFVQQFADGNTLFKCHHDHCTQTIFDLLMKYPLRAQPCLVDDETGKGKLFNHIMASSKFLKDSDGRRFLKYGQDIVAFDSDAFKSLLCSIANSTFNMLCPSNAANTIKDNISGQFDSLASTVPIGTRLLFHDDALYYNMEKGKILKIATDGIDWYYGDSVYFTYPQQFQEQQLPDLSSPASALPDLVEQIFRVNEADRLRFLAQLCCFYLPNVATPILVLSGGHGTSKTTTAKKLMNLVDPSLISVIAMPDKDSDLTANLSRSYIAAFDNVTKLSQNFSDLLCIACTSGYIAKRRLFTDNEQFAASINCRLILNGIGNFIAAADLAERCNVICLDPIESYRSESIVWNEFRKLTPQLPGSIFNTLQAGLALLPVIDEENLALPRMTEFGRYGAACIMAMGLDHHAFLESYKASNRSQLADCSISEPFCKLILDFAKNNNPWTGKANDLMTELSAVPNPYGVTLSNMSPSSLSRKLKEHITDLESVGVSVSIKSTTPKLIEISLLEQPEA